MTTERLGSGCWTVDLEPVDIWNFEHFDTHLSAESYRVARMHECARDFDPDSARQFAETGVTRLAQRCLILRCDGDGCGATYTDPDGAAPTVHLNDHQLAQVLHEDGWTTDGHGRHHCPHCRLDRRIVTKYNGVARHIRPP